MWPYLLPPDFVHPHFDYVYDNYADADDDNDGDDVYDNIGGEDEDDDDGGDREE